MKKNFEYKEPEFKVVITNEQDVLTTSHIDDETLPTGSSSWDTGSQGGGIGFGL